MVPTAPHASKVPLRQQGGSSHPPLLYSRCWHQPCPSAHTSLTIWLESGPSRAICSPPSPAVASEAEPTHPGRKRVAGCLCREKSLLISLWGFFCHPTPSTLQSRLPDLQLVRDTPPQVWLLLQARDDQTEVSAPWRWTSVHPRGPGVLQGRAAVTWPCDWHSHVCGVHSSHPISPLLPPRTQQQSPPFHCFRGTA